MQEERYIAAVDFGTSTISLSVSLVTPQDIKVVYMGRCDSEGIMNGTIANSKNVVSRLKPLIEEAESEIAKKINKLVVNWPRANVRCQTVNASHKRSNPDNPVSVEEIAMLRDMARELVSKELSEADSIYDIIPMSYSIDEFFQISEDEIIGATGDIIEGSFLAFIGQAKARKSIDMVISGLEGISVASYCFTPACTSHYVITPEEKEHGIALIELGCAVTSVSVFYKGVIRYFRSFPFGGKDITNDIRSEGNMSFPLAENVKKGYGSCLPDKLYDMENKCLQIDNPDTGTRTMLQVKYLAEIINCRMKEIANTCLYLIGESGYADKLRCGIVLCGGGAQLPNCHNLFYSLSGLQTKIGVPNYFGTTAECSHEAMLLSAKDCKSLDCTEEIGLFPPIPEQGGLFRPDEIEVRKPETEKKTTGEKAVEGRKKGKKGIGGILDTIGELFENNYDKMGKDNNDE